MSWLAVGPSPQPLSRGERGFGFSLLPSGEGAPQGDEGAGRSCSISAGRFAPYPHPNPSPGGRGALASPFSPREKVSRRGG
ncbi:hypothetical protein DYQ93_16105 [Xanthomonas sp. LMG 8992]|nr:hypothetical protein [Xanthomonas sp. LMG 8992]